ncbi:trans-aconitate methyltransferase [Asanoa ishikariensis]|uniref:Methyltransferase domain-containing protein n=1 Tax=Asanoa ishikariensis TaxID=137265 RepID=A0A1H3RH17_9ACTN|nr:class I SAM-dependent methyltransferase [Asanoa ishikariensis]GIF67253.1 trans-aconitate methyltransferase [Asanoa ishikariensis]SDZ24508.1 Methyltransferase domain-containing protein [Asanoa ishikariensis]
MTSALMPKASPNWLRLREAADAAARSAELVAEVHERIGAASRLVIHDLGCGTGSAARWLAPQLPAAQHWIMWDRDPDLLAAAMSGKPEQITAATRQRDLGTLTAADLAGADLVTASALIDVLTLDEVEAIAAACAGAGVPALIMLSVVGRVELDPADPFDDEVAAAFNAHQRRAVGGRRLLGPDAVAALSDAFARHGVSTTLRPSPWELGVDDRDLLVVWFQEWLDAAVEQVPALGKPSTGYARRRLAEIADGRLTATVHHVDLLATP